MDNKFQTLSRGSAENSFDGTVDSFLSPIKTNDYAKAVFVLIIAIYAALAAPKLPPGIAVLFDKWWFRLIFFFFIIYVAGKSPTVAIITAIAFLVSVETLNRLRTDQQVAVAHVQAKAQAQAQVQAQVQEQVEQAKVEMMATVKGQNDGSVVVMGADASPMAVDELSLISGETKVVGGAGDSCTHTANFRNSFYPQYVNMKPDAYLARYNGEAVNGYDPLAMYTAGN